MAKTTKPKVRATAMIFSRAIARDRVATRRRVNVGGAIARADAETSRSRAEGDSEAAPRARGDRTSRAKGIGRGGFRSIHRARVEAWTRVARASGGGNARATFGEATFRSSANGLR